MTSAEIGSFTLSDHAPTSCILDLGEEDRSEWHWRINESLLKDKEYEQKISQEMDLFFSTNETDEVTPLCIWETHKCVMRGVLISLGAHKKKKLNEQIETLLKKIREVELIHKKSQTQQIEEKLNGLREDLNSLLIEQAKAKLKCGRWTLYEFGNKPSRMLAKALKDATTQKHLSGIRTQRGEMVNSSQEMV